jgi:hypothetical protein
MIDKPTLQATTQDKKITVNDTTLPATIKPPRISKRIRSVVDLIVSGQCKTITAASERIGLAYDYVRRELKKPSVRVFIERRSRETLAAGTMRASARLIELLDAGSEHVSLDASIHTLAIAGIKPPANPQVAVNIDVRAGYIIDLSEPGGPAQHIVVGGDQPAPAPGGPVIEHQQTPSTPADAEDGDAE